MRKLKRRNHPQDFIIVWQPMVTSTPQGKKHLVFFFGSTNYFSLTDREETFTRIDTV